MFKKILSAAPDSKDELYPRQRFLYAFSYSMEARPNPQPPLFGLPLLLIALTALCVVLPFSWLGIPSGHDFEFHLNSWIEVLDHWKQGVLYPHWTALAHYGYGEARFIFYPPSSWMLGGALCAFVPARFLPAAYIFLALSLSGSSMFLLARRYFSRSAALFAALLYLANPYHLVIVYWRSAFAELLAAALLPLLLMFVLRFDEEGPRTIAPLSLVLAAGWLTNVPTAIMMNYSVAALALWVAVSRRSWRVLLHGGIAVLLGAALSAAYIVPVLHQQSWVNIGQVLEPGVRPADSFLFTITSDLDHNRFNWLVSAVAVWEVLLTGVLLVSSRRNRHERLWQLLLVWTALCVILMMRFTLPLWMHLPELRFVQFPWRWLLCLNVAFALGSILALRPWWLRLLLCVLALASVSIVWHRILPPWWDSGDDIREMVDNQHQGIGNEGTDEYVPAGVDPYDADQNAPRVRFEGEQATIDIQSWQAEARSFSVNASSRGNLVLHLFDYPCWHVKVNGRTIPTESAENTGQMIVPVERGESQIEIKFSEGWDRAAGSAISLLTFIALAIFHRTKRRRTLSPRPA